MTAKKKQKKRLIPAECPNKTNGGNPYSLSDFLPLLQEKTFAQFFLETLKKAEGNDPDAIACVDSYLAPTDGELKDLCVPASQVASMRKCTDSGLLVSVTAKQNS